MDPRSAVFFDVDGVLIDSVSAKGEAFAAAFAEFPEHRDAIIAVHFANGGVPRGRKFELIHEQILGTPLSSARAEELTSRFAADVVRRVIAAPEIPGAARALADLYGRCRLHAISAVPTDELEFVLASRGLLDYFASVHGVPPSKSETVAVLMASHGYRADACVFVGDSPHDYVAAADNAIAFIHVGPGLEDPVPGASAIVPDLRGLDSVVEQVLREARA
ncbi:MAG: hypothetical protein QG661_2350 [Actinomycetota bacterium]|nr:hypothetical protein [Actinomycetota bacterium]